MSQEIKNYVDKLFFDIPRSGKVTELKKELLLNMSVNYENYIQQGKTEEEAYDIVVNDSKDLDELLVEIPVCEEFTQEAHYYRKRNAKNTAIGVGMYIIGAAFLIGLGGFGDYFGKADYYGLIGLLILLVISAFATGLIIYTHMSTPHEYKDYKNQSKNEYPYLDEKHGRLLNNILSIYWIFVTFIYLAVSFATMRWDITWLIWILASVFHYILETVFEMRYGDE